MSERLVLGLFTQTGLSWGIDNHRCPDLFALQVLFCLNARLRFVGNWLWTNLPSQCWRL
jgi:hypothetical protein